MKAKIVLIGFVHSNNGLNHMHYVYSEYLKCENGKIQHTFLMSQPTFLLNSILTEDARIFDDVPQDASHSTRLGVG